MWLEQIRVQVEVHRMNEIFCQFLLEKVLIMSTRTCKRILKICMPEIIFKKNNSKSKILNHVYFCPKFIFWGVLQGVLASTPFIFCRRPAMVFDIFTQSPITKMFSTTLLQCHEITLLYFLVETLYNLNKRNHQSAKFQTFHCSREISSNLYVDKLLLLEVYEILA